MNALDNGMQYHWSNLYFQMFRTLYKFSWENIFAVLSQYFAESVNKRKKKDKNKILIILISTYLISYYDKLLTSFNLFTQE